MTFADPEVLYAPTEDGWRLALCRFAGNGAGVYKRHPVLMVHGLGANRLNMDLDDRYSIARAAALRGFDVYVLELRGAGLSRAPHGRDRSRYQWGFADYAERDLPAAIRMVLERSGAPKLHGLGHSMGGMLFYAAGARKNPYLRSIIAVGAPFIRELHLAPQEARLLKLASRLTPERLQRLQAKVPMRRLMGAAGRFIPLGSRLVDGLLLNADNTATDVLTRMAKEGIDDVPLQLVLELSQQMAQPSDTGPYAYETSLHQIEVPTYVMGGSVDRIAPPLSVGAAVERLTAPDIRFRMMGKVHGDSADYGHVDLLVGKASPEEVFPLLLDFLEEID